MPDYLCDRRVLRPVEFEGNRITQEDVDAFAGQPLVNLGKDQHVAAGASPKGLDNYVVRRTEGGREERAAEGGGQVPEAYRGGNYDNPVPKM